MATGPRFVVELRRRRVGKTNYKKRLALLKSEKTRCVIRISNKQVVCQFVNYSDKGDKTVVLASSNMLEKYGWKNSGKNLPAAYLCGFLAGKLALAKKVKKAVLDIGLQSRTRSRIFSAAKGVTDAGVDLNMGEGAFPDEKRIAGEHINEKIQKDFKATKEKISKQ